MHAPRDTSAAELHAAWSASRRAGTSALVLGNRRAERLALLRPLGREIDEPQRRAAAVRGRKEPLDEDPLHRAGVTARGNAIRLRHAAVAKDDLGVVIDVRVVEERRRPPESPRQGFPDRRGTRSAHRRRPRARCRHWVHPRSLRTTSRRSTRTCRRRARRSPPGRSSRSPRPARSAPVPRGTRHSRSGARSCRSAVEITRRRGSARTRCAPPRSADVTARARGRGQRGRPLLPQPARLRASGSARAG